MIHWIQVPRPMMPIVVMPQMVQPVPLRRPQTVVQQACFLGNVNDLFNANDTVCLFDVPFLSQQLFDTIHVDVSKNRGTPKWMVYNGKPYEQMDDLGVPLFLETPIYLVVSWMGFARLHLQVHFLQLHLIQNHSRVLLVVHHCLEPQYGCHFAGSSRVLVIYYVGCLRVWQSWNHKEITMSLFLLCTSHHFGHHSFFRDHPENPHTFPDHMYAFVLFNAFKPVGEH